MDMNMDLGPGSEPGSDRMHRRESVNADRLKVKTRTHPVSGELPVPGGESFVFII